MNQGLQTILIYMVFMSIIGFSMMGIDKGKARKGAWRIAEKTLMGIAFLGGGAGVWMGMEMFHHKTKHFQFKYGVPVITMLEFIAACYVFT